MLAKLKAANPVLKQNYDGTLEVTFPIKDTSAFGARELMKMLEKNEKSLTISVDFEKKQRTLSQNDLLWGLLTEYARILNGGRKNPDLTAESLYLKAINDYGKDLILDVVEGAETELKRVFRRVFIIDKHQKGDKVYSKCRCVVGSSKYNTSEMRDLIDGVLDEMSKNGVTSEQIKYLRSEYEK